MKRILAAICSLLVSGFPLPGRQEPAVCGTHRETGREALLLHRKSLMWRQAQRRAGLLRAETAALQQVGNLVVMDDTDGVVARRNLFDLDKRTLTFQPLDTAAKGYTFTLGDSSYDSTAAGGGNALTLGDDDSTRIALPFPFPFYGNVYREAWVNSDGNLTFQQGDSDSSSRSLGRLTSGPPRIAPLFDDLDPSRAGQVRILAEAGRLVLSWVNVAEYRSSGTGPTQRFQLRVFPDGRIEMTWDGTNPGDAVTGIAPGRLQGSTAVISFATDAPQQYGGAVAERFGATDSIDVVRASQRFFEQYEDAYDYLAFFNRVGIEAAPGALAYEITVRTNTMGIGDTLTDAGATYGSASRLRAVLNMGPLSQFPTDPYARAGGRGQITGDNTMTLIGHETGHLFLALASIRDPANPDARPMLNEQNLAHWSFNFDSEASLLEGNRIADRGTSSQPRFLTTATVEGYAPLDQYLMGFRRPDEVPPVFLARNTGQPSYRFPQVGVSFPGDRQDVRVEDVIAAEGRRVPDSTVAQRRFRFAFILITHAGDAPTQAEIDKLENFRKEFETYYPRAASSRALADAALKRSLKLSAFPAAGLLAGKPGTATLTIASAAAQPVRVSLSASDTRLDVPASVTIPAGALSTRFAMRGAAAGVFDLTAQADDSAFETAVARVRVNASAAALRLEQAAGLPPLTPGQSQDLTATVRVLDENNVPYSGVSVDAHADGTLDKSQAVTDENGVASFRWQTSTGLVRSLTAGLTDNAAAQIVLGVPGPPVASSGATENAASYQPGLSPGMLATQFGFNLWNGQSGSVAAPWPLILDGVEAHVNGLLAPLFFLSLTQANFLVPSDVAEGTATVFFRNTQGDSQPVQVNVTRTLPGLFYDPATGLAAVRQLGQFVELYGTGLGPVKPPNAQGTIETVLPVTVRLSGQTVRVVFSGLSGGLSGLYQVNIELPAGLGAGTYPVELECDGRRSNTAQLAVR